MTVRELIIKTSEGQRGNISTNLNCLLRDKNHVWDTRKLLEKQLDSFTYEDFVHLLKVKNFGYSRQLAFMYALEQQRKVDLWKY